MKLRKLLPMNLQIFADGTEPGTDPGAEPQAGDPTPGTGGESTNPETKTFTQADVDKIIQDRLAREKKELPPKEEIEAYKKWKEEQKTKEEKTNDELERLRKEAEDYKKKTELFESKEKAMKKSVPADFLDFVVFQASKTVDENTDFDKALDTFLAANPQYTEAPTGQPKRTGMRQGGSPSTMSEVEELFYKRNPDLKPGT